MDHLRYIMNKLLCFIGLHQWVYNQDNTKRWCKYCNKTQEYWCNCMWLECIDGEPIEQKEIK